jgi:cytochrome oxidase Cu insertion factor (SCO1/SenC/PrrC family)
VRLGPRAKLLLVMAIFAAPILASYATWRFFRPAATANHGELLLPPAALPDHELRGAGGAGFRFTSLRGRWVLVASDSGACPEACVAKLSAMRQVRLALGRDAGRVARVFVADDVQPVAAAVLAPFEGMEVAQVPTGLVLPAGAANDRAHIYLSDPNGNVMMRWPAGLEPKQILQDLRRLLKASQIG